MNLESLSHSARPRPGGPPPGLRAGRVIPGTADGVRGAVDDRVSIRDPGTDVRSDEIALPAGRDESASREEMPEVRARVEEEAARLQGLNRSLHFRVHEDSGQLLVQVVDRRTGEILRESPPEDFLELAVRLREMVGAFLDQTT